MVRGKITPLAKQQEALTLNELGYSINEIIDKTKLPRSTLNYILQRGSIKTKADIKGVNGRPSKITKRIGNRIKRAIKKNKFTTLKKIQDDIQVNISTKTIGRFLKKYKFRRVKMKTKPYLNSIHIKNRIQFAKDNVQNGEKWKKIIFCDEKKFNLDGPDGYRYFWSDLQKEDEKYFSKNIHNKQSIMVWGAFSWEGTLNLKVIETTMNAQSYTELLEECLVPYIEYDEIFQQDNAPIHTAKIVKDFLKNNKVQTLKWPAYSPDLNPIENLWSYLVRKIYDNNISYSNNIELKNAIFHAWKNIPDSLIESLVKSMGKRCIDIIEKQGKYINY